MKRLENRLGRSPSLRLLVVASALGVLGAVTVSAASSPVRYEVSLAGRDHHEMKVSVTFDELPPGPLEVRMSRTSPGRYALHEFAKNVYDVSALDGTGRELSIEQPDLHQWTVSGHDGTVVFHYTLFGDLSDGTYAAIDSSHAHLNIPASFVWARGLEARPVEVSIQAPEGWRVFSQMPEREDGTLTARDLAFFIDSPIEVSAAEAYSWTIGEGAERQTIELVLHHTGGETEAHALVDVTKLLVDEQVALFGEAPRFDHGRYTFLVDALEWSDGDGMEHRDSTVVTTGGSVEERIMGLLGTNSHEFFHAWNVERIRPASLEPFDLEAANVSRELWFAEGFTSYYGNLVMARVGADSLEELAETLGGYVGAVLGSPGVARRSAAEMSSRAPFVDAAIANEPTNWGNTFLSYYTYGAALGLALDLTLRTETRDLSLDDFMRAAWKRFGASERPYDNDDLRLLLGELTGDPQLADGFFTRSVTGRTPPDFAALLASVGLRLRPRNPGKVWLGGVALEPVEEDGPDGAGLRVAGPPPEDSSLWRVGVGRDDVLLRLDGERLGSIEALREVLETRRPGETVELVFAKRGEERSVWLELEEDSRLEVVTFEAAGESLPPAERARREAWLAPRAEPRLEIRRYCPRTGQPYPFRYRHCPVHGDDLTLGPATRGVADPSG